MSRLRTFLLLVALCAGTVLPNTPLLAAPSPGAAGDATGQAPKETADERESNARSNNNNTTDDGAEPSSDQEVFVPTEEISEDFAVPFPVDI